MSGECRKPRPIQVRFPSSLRHAPQSYCNSLLPEHHLPISSLATRHSSPPLIAVVIQVDVDRERPDLLHQNVERLGHAGLDPVIALDDRLVDLAPTLRIVRLDREHLLQRVGSAVSLERPHLHFAETLSAELRLAAQRL